MHKKNGHLFPRRAGSAIVKYVRKARLLKIRLRVVDGDGLDAGETLDWITRAFQNRCRFEHAEIEFNQDDQDGVGYVFECHIITDTKDRGDPIAIIETAMLDFCDFDKARAVILRDVDGVWVMSDFSLPSS